VDVYGHSHGGIVTFGAATLTSQIRSLVLCEGWPVPDPLVYALPADVEERMDQLLARGDRDGVVEALFRSLEDMSDEDMTAIRITLGNSTVRDRFTGTPRIASLVQRLRGGACTGAARTPSGVGSGLGLVEGWRGTVAHRVELDDTGRLSRAKVVDPSFFNWPALPVALTDTIVPDFPWPTRASTSSTQATSRRKTPVTSGRTRRG
jgi:hypothetical protein